MIYVEDRELAVYLEDLGYKPREMIFGGTFNHKDTYIYTYDENKRLRQLLLLYEEGMIG